MTDPVSAPITVWGVGTTRTFRVHWMLHELGLEYETRRIESRTGETTTSEYTKLNPKQKIPILIHQLEDEGDLVLSESFAILKYLRRLGGLPYDDFQQSIRGQAVYDEWVSFILMELDATSLYVIRRHKDLPEIYGDAPAAVESCLEYFDRMMQSVSHRMTPGEPIWGSTFSELDILMSVALDWADVVGAEVPETAKAYQAAMHARPAYKAAAAHNFRDLKIPTRP